MIDFNKGEVKDIMPVNLISSKTEAVSYAVGQAMRRLQEFSKACRIYGELSKVPEPVVDLLALELNTQYYDQTMSRKLKEQLIIQTTAWYMHAGTPGVLKEFLGTVLDGGEIREWFQYGGTPYHFKVLVQVGEHEIPLGYGLEVKGQIELYKNARSWLEHVAFIIWNEVNCNMGVENAVRFRGEFYPRFNTPYLKLNGLWMLANKKLNGYDMDEIIDFYPVKQNWKLKVSENILLWERQRMTISVEIKEDICVGLRFLGQTCQDTGTENNLILRSTVQEKAKPGEVRVVTMIKLTSNWKLNGNRKLNGGLSIF